jgi:hypothetical protein
MSKGIVRTFCVLFLLSLPLTAFSINNNKNIFPVSPKTLENEIKGISKERKNEEFYEDDNV